MAQTDVRTQQMQSYIARVFSWMCGALALTGGTAYAIASIPVLAQFVLGNPGIMFIAILAQLGFVIALSFHLRRLSVATASFLFWGYALLTGITFSSIFLVYTQMSIASAFLVAAGMFGAMAVYGATTETNLASFGSYFRMAVFGLIIAMVVNLFIGGTALDLAISLVGVVIFSGLTAYDMQKLQQIASHMDEIDEDTTKITIIMSLQLYLDFINLFLMLLKLMGNKKR